MNYILTIFILALSLFVIISATYTVRYVVRARRGDPTIWERTIQKFEKVDEFDPSPTGAILFTGSSSIRFWKTLEEDMATLEVINRGFGGSQIHEVAHYVDRIIFPHKPRGIVFYAGENDMSGLYFTKPKTPFEVRENYRQFCERVHAKLPDVPIYFISIKPPKTRQKFWKEMKRANEMILEFCLSDERLHYIDITEPMLDEQGNTRVDLFKWDGIHMNTEGYRVWTSVIKPILVNRFT
jgi:lysophospholipase L1-like esterase